jgi:hypothetical protein
LIWTIVPLRSDPVDPLKGSLARLSADPTWIAHHRLVHSAYPNMKATANADTPDAGPGSFGTRSRDRPAAGNHAAPSSGAKYAIDSKLTQAIRDLSERFEHRLFLSAPPTTATRTASPPCSRSSTPSASGAQHQNLQLRLDFDDDEKRQLESNKRHWEMRLHAIDRDLATEPRRVRAHHEVKAQWIEPVGWVYLWPVTG